MATLIKVILICAVSVHMLAYAGSLHAQQFIDQTYKITSFKDVQYANAVGFDVTCPSISVHQ